MTMIMPCIRFILSAFWITLPVIAIYNPVHEYAGDTFFNGWTWYDNVDNTTWGNVTYVSTQASASQGLAYYNQNTGRVVLKVDNVTNLPGPTDQVPFVHRNSVRITTTDSYGIGNLVLIDIVHLPYGCSVWPSFWTLGTNVPEWPEGGEIDIIETINLMTTNQMALHTETGCNQTLPEGTTIQSGETLETDCSHDRGCVVSETKNNSVGEAFANAGGGVWALQMDITGFYIWFWSRPDIPLSISQASSTSSIDISDFGMPSAAYPAGGCDLERYFTPQQLILCITLCGTWAGIPDVYSETCQTTNNSCVYDNIIGVGTPTYDQAYFDINWIRTYEAADEVPTESGASTWVIPPSSSGTASATGSGVSSSPTDPFNNAALSNLCFSKRWFLFTVLAGLIFCML